MANYFDPRPESLHTQQFQHVVSSTHTRPELDDMATSHTRGQIGTRPILREVFVPEHILPPREPVLLRDTHQMSSSHSSSRKFQ